MFFNPKYSARKCLCGEVFGFHVQNALDFVGAPALGEALRSYVRLNGIGCTGVKVWCFEKQYVGIHIRRTSVPEDLQQVLDNGEP